MFAKMTDGTLAYGPKEVLNLFDEVIKKQMKVDQKAKFKVNEKVKICATKDELIKYIQSTGETYLDSKKEAILLLSNDYGVILGKTECEEGSFYTIEFELFPMYILPEKFLTTL